MIKLLLRCLFPLLLLLVFLFYSTSQYKGDAAYSILLDEYLAAQSSYDKATALSEAADYSEKEESLLNKEALRKFQSLDKKLPPASVYDSLRFFTSFKIGELQHYFEHFKEALDGYRKSIDVKLKSSLPDSLLFKPYLYSGIIYYNQNKYDSATLFFRSAENIQSKYNYGIKEGERLYNTFGVLYYEKGDYLQAKNYFSKALETLSPVHPYHDALYLNYNINLAQIYFKLEDYNKANKIYQKLLTLHPANTNEIYHNLGLINLYLGAADKAMQYFKKVTYSSSNKVIWLYNNIGEAFLHLGQHDSARVYFTKAITTNRLFGSNTDHNAYGRTIKSLGDLEMRERSFRKALSNYQHAIHQFYPAYTDTAITANPQKFTGVFSYINLFNTLVAKAEAFHQLYVESKALTQAQEELKAYQSAFALLDYVEKTYNSDEARLFLEKTKHLVHGKPIDIAYELYEKTGEKKFLEDLYLFDQQNKASVLAIKSGFTRSLSQKDTSLVTKERAIRSDITRFSLRASQLTDTNEIIKINSRIRDGEIELGKLQEQLRNISYANNIPSVSIIQKTILDTKTAILSFHLSADKLTTIIITQNSFRCLQQSLYPGYNQEIQAYVKALQDPAGADSVKEPAGRLYSFLLGKADLRNTERLIIIPDDELNYLSFESLLDNNGKYLIETYSVQYQYSTALLKKEPVDFREHQTLSFAPFTKEAFSNSGLRLEKLPHSLQEINALKGKKLTDTAGTKINFLYQLSNYKVIHLATHAFVNPVDDNFSYISFYPGNSTNKNNFLLYTKEIYNLPLEKTNLIILSACETGAGNLVRGEGIMSLSRAFAYAGCPNIITSLWSASDFSTAYLTRRIHFYLDENYPVDIAVRRAKLDYLADRSVNPRLKNPFYWSNLIFIGNTTVTGNLNFIGYIIAALVLAGLAIWIKIKKPYKNYRAILMRNKIPS